MPAGEAGVIDPWWPAAGAAAGLIAGSFLSTVAIRLGQGVSIARGRSRCDGCGVVISAPGLVPLASFVVQRGRCRSCGAAIDRRHPLLELACALIGALALAVHPGVAGAAGAVFGWLLATLALIDIDHFWLPDRLVAPLGLAGLGAGLLGLAPPIADRLIGAAGGFGLLAAVGWAYRRWRGRDGLGGGDAKLFAAIGAWLGWHALPATLLLAALAGLGWCLVMIAAGRTVSAGDRLPFGALLALAAWPLWLSGALSPA